MRIRSILSLAVSAVAAMALATPAQAADDGSYFIRDVRGGACLAGGDGPVGGHVEPCNPGTVWEIHNQGNGLARIVEARGEGRCLALSPVRIYPPAVWVDQCGNQPDQWSIQDTGDGEPVVIALGRGEFGFLSTQDDGRAVLLPEARPQWILQRLG
ncbi:RICIN domain-containing protein [Streptomyces sp. NPDC059278]|uniref:RICIN domain-containing protein n=1 Tax=Streptomyces sp. NPDC059278 TaxID=3346801 RepID=UPI0036CC9C00